MEKEEVPFRDIAIETASRAVIERIQLEGLRRQVEQGLKTDFYRKRFKAAGISSPDDIRTLADIRKLPFTTKNDLRDAYPFGLLAVPALVLGLSWSTVGPRPDGLYIDVGNSVVTGAIRTRPGLVTTRAA